MGGTTEAESKGVEFLIGIWIDTIITATVTVLAGWMQTGSVVCILCASSHWVLIQPCGVEVSSLPSFYGRDEQMDSDAENLSRSFSYSAMQPGFRIRLSSSWTLSSTHCDGLLTGGEFKKSSWHWVYSWTGKIFSQVIRWWTQLPVVKFATLALSASFLILRPIS